MSGRSVTRQLLSVVSLHIFCLSTSTPPVLAQSNTQNLKHPPGRFILVEGVKLWYESEGRGEPLLLIAGGPGFSHSYFHPYFSALKNSQRVVYYDAVGCGKSDRATPSRAYSFAGAVDEVEGLRRALKLGKMNVLGHSYGGFVAQAYAVKYPGSVKRLIIINTVASGEELQLAQNRYNDEMRDQLPEKWAEVQELRRARGLRSSAEEHQKIYGIPPTLHYFYNPDKARRLRALGEAEPLLHNPDLWYALAGEDADFTVSGDLARFDVREDLKHLPMPVLVLAGRFDGTRTRR